MTADEPCRDQRVFHQNVLLIGLGEIPAANWGTGIQALRQRSGTSPVPNVQFLLGVKLMKIFP
jgi:hypothetical protein